jgi:hypothetical protein
MKKVFKFPSIESFSSIVKNVREKAKFVGLDDEGKAIFDETLRAPVYEFHGTVKIHGTNASICYNEKHGLWVQSRTNIITPLSDNAGFAGYVEANKESFMKLVKDYVSKNNLDVSEDTVCIYGEWCGGSIQKGVAVNKLSKMFVIFGIKLMQKTDKIDPETGEVLLDGSWLNHIGVKNESIQCYNIEDFPTFKVVVDFENPKLSQNEIIDLTIQVEEKCPVGFKFGVEGIGEGIVFSCTLNDGSVVRFKSKGEKHSKTKVKVLKEVDNELEVLKQNLALELTPDWRVDQAIQEVFNTLNNGVVDVKGLGDVIKWVLADIVKEESHKLAEAKIELKQLSSYISANVKKRFFVVLQENLV